MQRIAFPLFHSVPGGLLVCRPLHIASKQGPESQSATELYTQLSPAVNSVAVSHL